MVKLLWSPKSPFVRKVMITAHELGMVDRLELVREVAAMNAQNPDIMHFNPLNKIPTLIRDDGAVIVDSLVVCQQLCDLAGDTAILPNAGEERLSTLTGHALANGLLDLLILWRNEREKGLPRQTAEWIAAFAGKTEATLNHFEHVAGTFSDRPRLDTITLFCTLAYMDFRFDQLAWRSERARLATWFDRFAARPSARLTDIADG